MLRALVSAIKIGLLVAAAIWVAQRPGTVELDWLDYHVKAHVGLVLFCLLGALVIVLFLHRLLLLLESLPSRWKKRQEHKQHEKGYQALTQGLTAVAAGDAKMASEKAQKTKSLWPQDTALSLLLEAQAARLRGEEDVARACFDKLLSHKDTAFLGLRGLLANALESGDTARALEFARQAQKMHPRQKWIVRLTYDLTVQARQWGEAEKLLKKAVMAGALDDKQAQADRVALLAAQADDLAEKGKRGDALSLLKKAHRLDEGSVPVAERLAALQIEAKNKRAATSVIERTWIKNPHPDLLRQWERLADADKSKKKGGRMRWYEKLVALNPGAAEGQIAAARAAMDEGLWGQARQYLSCADQIEPSARLYRLYARLEDAVGHGESAHHWLEKAAEAPGDRVWTCRETGQIFERWSPVTPYGSFNTMVWDYPKARAPLTAQALLPQNELLVTAR